MITLSTYAKRLNVCTSAISYGVFVLVKSTLQNMPGTNRMLSWMAMSVFASGVVLSGCGPAMTRPQRERNDLVKLRTTGDEHATAAIRKLVTRLMERTKAEYDQYNTGQRKVTPVINILIVSGGGDWGAFGAGFLKGWMKVPADHPLAKPEFDAVTGVSTGTLIAPFAFLGDEKSIDEIVNLYRNPQEDWVKQRGMLFFLPGNISFAEVPVSSARCVSTSRWTWLVTLRGRAPMAGCWQ